MGLGTQIGGDTFDGLMTIQAGVPVGIEGGNDSGTILGVQERDALCFLLGVYATMKSVSRGLALNTLEEIGDRAEETTEGINEIGRKKDGDSDSAIVSVPNREDVTWEGSWRGHRPPPGHRNVSLHNIYYAT